MFCIPTMAISDETDCINSLWCHEDTPFSICNSKKECILENINNSTIDKLRLEISKRKLSSTFVVIQNFCLKKITNNHFGCRFLSTCDGILSHKEKFMLYVKWAYGNESFETFIIKLILHLLVQFILGWYYLEHISQ